MKTFIKILIIVLLFSPIIVFSKEEISNAKSGILIEANTGKIIYEKNSEEKLPMASLTKMMAQIIILENIESGKIKWSDIVTVSKNAADMGGSQIYLTEGEKITIEDLMKGISMASGNDATVQMAEVISGSEEKFVDLMNKKAKELGLKNTSFKNSTGLDENNHYSTAKDLSLIAQELINKHPEILKFSSLYEDYLREDTPNKFWLVNTNKLIRFYDGADGLKTGHTDNAHYCLAATAKRDNLRLIAIVLGEENSKIRNSEAMSLLDYGFSNINFNLLKEKGTLIKEIKLDKATKDTIPIILKNDLGVVELIDNNTHKYHYDIKLDNLKLPIKKNSIVGKIKVIENNNIVSIGDLIVEEDIERLKYIELLINNLKDIVTGNL